MTQCAKRLPNGPCGICPVTRCAKRLLNGPCGGSSEDHCEVNPDRPCAWQPIYNRLKEIGRLDRLDEIAMPKDWSTAWYSGARKIVRKEHQVQSLKSPWIRARGMFLPSNLRFFQLFSK